MRYPVSSSTVPISKYQRIVICISHAYISYIHESPTMILKDYKQASHDTYIIKCKSWYLYKMSMTQAHNNSLRAESQHQHRAPIYRRLDSVRLSYCIILLAYYYTSIVWDHMAPIFLLNKTNNYRLWAPCHASTSSHVIRTSHHI